MKRCLQLSAVLIFINATLNAQTYNKTTIKVGESLSDHFYYLYPSFTNATVKIEERWAFDI